MTTQTQTPRPDPRPSGEAPTTPATANFLLAPPRHAPQVPIGWCRQLDRRRSLASGLAAALLLVVAPFIPAQESAITGAVLCGYAFGWSMLAVLSVRLTEQPQRWAAAPAVLMGWAGCSCWDSAPRLVRPSAGSGLRPYWPWPPG